MRWCVWLVLVAVACKASWPKPRSLPEAFQQLYEETHQERPGRPVHVVPLSPPAEEADEHVRERRAVAPCSGVGTRIATEDLCGLNDCHATAYVCPGSTQQVAMPTNYSTCTVAAMSCTGSLGGATRAVLPPNCMVARTWNCTGEQYQWNTAAVCAVRELVCPAALVSFDSSASCVVATLSCNGQPVTNSSVVTVTPGSDPCVVSRSPCATGQSCFDWVRLCNSSASCEWRGQPCVNGCLVANTAKNVCNCPADFLPPTCATKRTVTCQFRLRDPDASGCEAVDEADSAAVDADPVCHRRTTKETVVFSYRIGCAFEDGYVAPADNFTYVVVAPNGWALSQAQYNSFSNWTAQFKGAGNLIFNWLRISDTTSTVFAPSLSPAQLGGQEDVSFSVDFSLLSAKHLVGARAYAEVGFTAATVRAMALSQASVRDRVFVDFTDLADLSQYPPAGAAPASARRASTGAGAEEEEEEDGLWGLFFAGNSALAAVITAGVVAVTMLFAWAVLGV